MLNSVLPAQEAEDYPHGDYEGDCSLCHGVNGWLPLEPSADFDHANFGYPDGFPLDGAHGQVACRACHLTLDFTRSPSECRECHQDIHRGELGMDCARCHNSRSFVSRAEMGRDHMLTRFPLTGAHRTLDCETCHTLSRGNLVYSLPVECVSCHLPAYESATDPNHAGSGFSTACDQCHDTTSWAGSDFDHNQTNFPLTGSHQAATCQACHANGVYAGTPAECISCHQAAYDSTTDPDHGQAGFAADCTLCHTTSAWTGADFDHNQTSFPLTGSHQVATCQGCHASGVYAGTQAECVACHQSDYDQTVDPQHLTSGFSTDCTSCHTTTTWSDATFDHDGMYFPIYSGRHSGLWTACSDCHVNSNNYAAFECTFCHQHNDENQVNNDHSELPGYAYDSQACFSCHPDGRS